MNCGTERYGGRDLRRVLLLLLVPLATAVAQDVTRLYSTAELESVSARYEPHLRGMWHEDFLPHISSDERRRAGAVTLDLPLVGARRTPIEHYANPVAHRVVLPIGSVKFLDDMSVAFAYYEKSGCDMGIVSDYAAALRLQGERIPGSPLEALGVPRSALTDEYVDNVAMKMLKSTVFFAAAHEFAHVMYQHRGYASLTAQQAQQQETEADLYALEVMRRIGVPPIALAQFFLLASRLEKSPGDFDTPRDYENYLREEATHPVSSQRLLNVAAAIETGIDGFARAEPDPQATVEVVRGLVPKLRSIAGTLDDRDMRRLLADRARQADVGAFRTACRP